jgi:hypothetical protein
VHERAGAQATIDELIGADRFPGQGTAFVPAGVRLDAAWTEALLTVGYETYDRDFPAAGSGARPVLAVASSACSQVRVAASSRP